MRADDDIRVDFYNRDPTKYQYVGFEISNNELREWWNAYGANPFQDGGDSGRLKIKGECWHGNEEQRPTDSDMLERFSRTVESNGDTVVAVRVPERSSISGSTGSAKYSCNYGFQQKWNPTRNLLIDPGNYYTGSSNRYIVQGSNDIQPITTSHSTTSAPDNLANYASETTEDPTPFENFPTGQTGGEIKDPFEVWDQKYN